MCLYPRKRHRRRRRCRWKLHRTENVILFNKVQVPHYNYVGDSVLGYKAHMGAGSITSNVKSDKKLVVVKGADEQIETGLKKFGARCSAMKLRSAVTAY